jgi:hypothetical protein
MGSPGLNSRIAWKGGVDTTAARSDDCFERGLTAKVMLRDRVNRHKRERMEEVSLILTALAAGASAGALDALKDDVKDKAKAACVKLLRISEIPRCRSLEFPRGRAVRRAWVELTGLSSTGLLSG